MSQESREETWRTILSMLSGKISEDHWSLLFKPIVLLEDDGKKLLLEVPNNIYQVWIESNYLKVLAEAVEEALGSRRSIEFRCNGAAPAPRPAGQPRRPAAQTRNGGPSWSEVVRRARLNPRYNFDAFVVGNSNEIAAAAAGAVAERPGKSYNPLFLYGGSGLGKTHLMHAIGLEILRRRPRARVVCITAEQYTNEYVDSIGEHRAAVFRSRYREADVLLVDDVHFFAGKERTQDEFFYTFETLQSEGKQMVMTCDRPAGEVKLLQRRLVTRFQGGLTSELAPPEKETRIAILRKKMKELDFVLTPEVVEFVAEHIRDSVRELEGCLNRLKGLASLSQERGGREITLDAAALVVGDLLGESFFRPVEIRVVQMRTAEYYEVSVEELMSRRRTARIAEARQMAMYICRRECRESLKEIGAAFKRDHATVIHACRAVEKRVQASRECQNAFQRIQSGLRR